MAAQDHDERAAIASLGGITRWAEVDDRAAALAKARAAFKAKFERQVDPDGVLPPEIRAQRAESARKAHYARLALAKAQKRRQAREAAALDEHMALEAEVATGTTGAAVPVPAPRRRGRKARTNP